MPATGATSAPGWRQAAGEGVAKEEGLVICVRSKHALMNVSWASLAVRGEYSVELGWGLGGFFADAPSAASSSWYSEHPWTGCWASLAARGECAVELGWAPWHCASEDLAASWGSAHCASDH